MDSDTFIWHEETVEDFEGNARIIAQGTDEYGNDETFAGPSARTMMRALRADPDHPVPIGIGTRRGGHASIKRTNLNRHTVGFGSTDYGKSTLWMNFARSVSESGDGMIYIEPKGDDAERLMQILPEHALDRVQWLEPAGNRSAETGFNFLSVGLPPEHPNFDVVVENIVEDLVKMIGVGEYWGPKMDEIATNLIRVAARTDYEFTLIDLYFILADEENRKKYRSLVEQEGLIFLQIFARQIADYDDDDLDAIRRRFKRWVENPIARRVFAHRGESINLTELIDERGILIVRMDQENENIKRMVGTAILRRAWAAARSRPGEKSSRGEGPDYFHLFMDEADLLAHEDSALPLMLSKARASRLCLHLCCQYPYQLPDDLIEALFTQCDTKISLSPGSRKSSNTVGKNMGLDYQTLRDEKPYHAWMKTSVGSPDPFRVYLLPPFPPLRTQAEAQHMIERIVRKVGTPPKTDQQVMDELLLNNGEGTLDGANAIGLGEDGDGPTLSIADLSQEHVEKQTCKTVHDAAIESNSDDGFVQVSDIQDRLIENLRVDKDALGHPSQIAGVFDMIGEKYIETDIRDDGNYVRCTSSGETLFKRISGSANDGDMPHRKAIRELYDALVDVGFDTEVVQNTQGRSADGFGKIERAFKTVVKHDILTAEDARQAREQFIEENPELAALSGGKNVRIELEHSTGDTGPGQTLRHLHDAIADGERCLYAARPETAWNVYDTLTDPMYCRDVDEDGRRRSFSLGTLTIDGEHMLRPEGGKTVWWYDPDPDDGMHWHLEDTDGTQYARFETREDLEKAEHIDKYPARESDFDNGDPEREQYVNVGAPTELTPDPDLSRDHWAVVIVPEGTSRAEDLSLIHHGEAIPFDEIGDLSEAEDLLSMSRMDLDESDASAEPSTTEDGDVDDLLAEMEAEVGLD